MFLMACVRYLFTKNRFKYAVLVTIFLFILLIQFTLVNRSASTEDEYKSFLRLLCGLNATLLQTDLLRTLKNDEILIINTHTVQKQLTFGIRPEATKFLTGIHLYVEYNLICEVIYSYDRMNSKAVTTTVYLKCFAENILIQFSVLHPRGDFMWIGSDTYYGATHRPKEFADVPRALNMFEVVEYPIKLNSIYGAIKAPKDIESFLYDYKRSKFLECNRTSAFTNRLKLSAAAIEEHDKHTKTIMPCFKYLTDTLDSMKKTYWLGSGSLLGWYRDCDIIPHTQDVDLFLWAHEYDKRIKERLLGNKMVSVWGQYGLVNDSLELRSYAIPCSFTFDLIFVYKYNTTAQWNAFHSGKLRFKQVLPVVDEFCSADLQNSKFTVPCNFIKQLNTLYESDYKWLTPIKSKYPQPSIDWEHGETWQPSQIPYIMRRYDIVTGELDKNLTLQLTNRFYDDISHQITLEQLEQRLKD